MGKVLSAEGCGYFPSCLQGIQGSTLGIATGSLENVMKLYWRVKEWKIDDLNGIFKFDQNYPDYYTSYSVSETNLNQVSEITEENKYVCKPLYIASTLINLTYFSPDQSEPGTTSFFITYGGNFYSGYGIQFSVGFAYNVSNLWGDSERSGQIGVLNINPFGISVPLYSYNDGNPGIPAGNVIANMSPREYWSYGGTYDTTTGELL